MESFKQRYQKALQDFIDRGEEDVLYQVYRLTKEFWYLELTPEELVSIHYEAMSVFTKDISAENVLNAINHSPDFLLEAMVAFGVSGGNLNVDKEDIKRWKDVVLRLNSSLNLCNNRHKVILDTIPIGVIVLNPEGVITFINQYFERFFNCTAESIVGRRMIDALNNGQAKKEDGTYCFKAVETLETGIIFNEVEHEEPNGCVYLMSTSIIRDENGNLAEVIATGRDITEKIKLRETLNRNERLAAIGTMAAGIVHEIRNPLFIVRGFVQLLQSEVNSGCGKDYLNIAMEEIDRANKVLNDFLSFARPHLPSKCPVKLWALVDEICQLTEGEAVLRDIDLEISCSKQAPSVFIDKNQIKQAMLNILKNAFEAVEENGKICLFVEWDDIKSQAVIVVKDNGPGMDEKTVSKIFEPFFTAKETGTGLGMSITYQIIQNHDGEIKVESKPGGGTKVTIFLPMIAVPAEENLLASPVCENVS